MFKFLYTIRFLKRGTRSTPKYLVTLYYKSRFVTILGFFDKIKNKALIYFDRVIFYYLKGFRLRKNHRYLDLINIVFVGVNHYGFSYFNNFEWIIPSVRGNFRQLYLKRHSPFKKLGERCLKS